MKFETYLRRSSDIMQGLTPTDVRKLARQCAVKYNINTPDSWKESNCAGPDWFTCFMKWYLQLEWYGGLYSLKPHTTVAEKGTKQVGSVTSRERGEMIIVAVNAIGNVLPPMFYFSIKIIQILFYSWGACRLHWSWERIRTGDRIDVCHIHEALHVTYPPVSWESSAVHPRQPLLT